MEKRGPVMLLSALSVELVSTVAHLPSRCLTSLSPAEEMITTKMAEASVGAGRAARCLSPLLER